MSDRKHLTIEQLSGIDLHTLPADGGPDFNRLIFEKNPYLLQHATNPISWRPWDETALSLAREQDKPIFLSIGYSTCHWCHVMADESFSDSAVAAILNEHYIPIKVDREERPDVDATYMQACQIMTGSGGWPLTLLLTPALHPFFAATYIPKHDRHGVIGLISLLNRINELWKTERDRINASGEQIHDVLHKAEKVYPSDDLDVAETLASALRGYCQQYDSLYGGFGQAPKFPAPHNLSLLLQIGYFFNDDEALRMALDSLRAIRLGGIYDQLAGGIHRYSVDERWLVPHFEKMLYDQALLINAAIDAWLAGGDIFYRNMATDTARYVSRTLKSPDGGFYCGEDADSEGKEGTSYLWTEDEISALFPADVAAGVSRLFGTSPAGNFEGKNILYLPEGLDDTLLENARQTMLPTRDLRPQPHLDDKILTGWNGLTIAALARLGALTGEAEWLLVAGKSADFIKSNIRAEDGRLLRRWRSGEASVPAFLEDYAFLVWGLLELYQACFSTKDLQWALQLTEEMLELFSDGSGGLYDTGSDAETILTRGRNLQDGAIPSGNGAATMALARLGLLTGREKFRLQAEELLKNNAGLIKKHPTAFSMSLIATRYLDKKAATLVIAGSEKERQSFVDVARSSYRPNLEIVCLNGDVAELSNLAPITRGKEAKQDGAKAWFCQGRSCHPPANSPKGLARLLEP